ncbi:alpha/beta hydrolase family protein, partial [Phyllobacterium sp. P5_D12]
MVSRRIWIVVFCIYIGVGSSSARTNEQIISFFVENMRVVGTLALPAQGHAPVVLMLHGFAGYRDEEGIFPRAAKALAAAGIASLRIDFRGAGDSEGSFADTTFSRQIDDGLKALRYLETDNRVDATRIGIIGDSQGGLVATIVASRSGIPKALALWSAVANPPATFESLFGKGLVSAGLQSGQTGVDVVGVHLRQPYFEDIYRIHPLVEIARYKGQLFAAEGSRDVVVGNDSAQRYIAAHGGVGDLW